MLLNIFKICLIVSVASSVALAKRRLLATEALLEGFPGQTTNSSYERVGRKLYYFSKEKLTWSQAFASCRLLGGCLASFNSPTDQATLSNYMIYKYPLDRFWWLSGSDLHSQGNFSWYGTGEPVRFADWISGQPNNNKGNERCLHIRYSFEKKKYKLNNWECNRRLNYICETKKPEAVILSML